MDVAYSLDSSVSGILANFTAPVSSSTPGVITGSTVPSSGWLSSTSTPIVEEASSTGASPVFALPTATTTTVGPLDQLTVGQQKLVEGLEEATKVLKEMAKPAPPVIIINQLPPSSPPAWHEDFDVATAGGVAVAIVFFLLVAGCFWLRRFRPDAWKRVKAGGWRVLKGLALPLSWMCGRAADLLRHLHAAAEGQHLASANPVQVSKTEFL